MKEYPAHCIAGMKVFTGIIGAALMGLLCFMQSPSLGTVLLGMCMVMTMIFLKGVVIVSPNEAVVLTFFGQYRGSITHNGIWWVNPLAGRERISTKVANFQSEQLKVNDALGNPIEIAAVIVWRVVDSAKATFEVESCTNFVHLQCETALRQLASHFPYEPHKVEEVALRSHPEEIADKLQSELQARVSLAGIEILQTQLSHLAYSPEIAQAMLRRQQAQAVIAARQLIVDGAIGMVEMALIKLEKDGIIQLDAATKSTMVNNLLVTLVSEHHIQPVMSTSPMK